MPGQTADPPLSQAGPSRKPTPDDIREFQESLAAGMHRASGSEGGKQEFGTQLGLIAGDAWSWENGASPRLTVVTGGPRITARDASLPAGARSSQLGEAEEGGGSRTHTIRKAAHMFQWCRPLHHLLP